MKNNASAKLIYINNSIIVVCQLLSYSVFIGMFVSGTLPAYRTVIPQPNQDEVYCTKNRPISLMNKNGEMLFI